MTITLGDVMVARFLGDQTGYVVSKDFVSYARHSNGRPCWALAEVGSTGRWVNVDLSKAYLIEEAVDTTTQAAVDAILEERDRLRSL